jgi:hypothetical protein
MCIVYIYMVVPTQASSGNPSHFAKKQQELASEIMVTQGLATVVTVKLGSLSWNNYSSGGGALRLLSPAQPRYSYIGSEYCCN